MSNYIDEKKLQDLLKNGKGIPFISPELIRVLGIDEMYRKQGALEEFVKIKQMYYRLDVNRFMEFLNQEKLRFEKELESKKVGVE